MIRRVSCTLLLLLFALAIVVSALVVAKYASTSSSWWLSMMAAAVCVLGLCTWMQLALSRIRRSSRVMQWHSNHDTEQTSDEPAAHEPQGTAAERERSRSAGLTSDAQISHIQVDPRYVPPPPYQVDDPFPLDKNHALTLDASNFSSHAGGVAHSSIGEAPSASR